MKEEAIVKSLVITDIGERQHFQIAMPRDIKQIIGFEYSVTGKIGQLTAPSPGAGPGDGLKVFPGKIIGNLVLRATGCEGIFLQSNLVEDKNIHFGETLIPIPWQPSAWTHGRKREETKLSVMENSIVYGVFQDSWGKGEYDNLSYQLHLYLWIEKCTT